MMKKKNNLFYLAFFERMVKDGPLQTLNGTLQTLNGPLQTLNAINYFSL